MKAFHLGLAGNRQPSADHLVSKIAPPPDRVNDQEGQAGEGIRYLCPTCR